MGKLLEILTDTRITLPETRERAIKALILELADKCRHPGETDHTGINRFHENGIIDPVLFNIEVDKL